MQLYAIDQNGELVTAREASRQTNYECLECQQIIRLRGGPQRQRHFYHLDPNPFCRKSQKSLIHLQLQNYFFQNLPSKDCDLEYPFPAIRRIADVVWHSQKIVFEIQYSPIKPEEVLARNRDYQQLGWSVVWILHDQRYNQDRLSGAEIALHSSPHFFSNMNEKGEGVIYDQFDFCEKGLRRSRLLPLPIEVTEIIHQSSYEKRSYPLMLLEQRAQTWNLSFKGDLMNSFFNPHLLDYFSKAIEIEKSFYHPTSSFTWRHFFLKMWCRGIARPYQIFFHFLLERMCR